MDNKKILPLEAFVLKVSYTTKGAYIAEQVEPYEECKLDVKELFVNIKEITTTSGLKDSNLNGRCYSCKFCMMDFPKQSEMIDHSVLHAGEVSYACNLCDYRCNSKTKLLLHTKCHPTTKILNCSVCGFKCVSVEALRMHSKVHIKTVYSCNFCDYTCAKNSNLIRHVRVHTGEKPYSCTSCNYRSSQSTTLWSHMLTHSRENSIRCSVCKIAFRRQQDLRLHVRSHMKNNIFACYLCEFIGSDQDSLNDHTRSHCTQKAEVVKNWQCHVCGKGFKTLNLLNDHKVIHKSSTSVAVSNGKQIFKYKFNNSDKILNFSTSNNSNLRINPAAANLIQKPFKCEKCHSGFTLRTSLQRHMLLHSPNKPYKCDLCDYDCYRNIYLKKHYSKHHS